MGLEQFRARLWIWAHYAEIWSSIELEIQGQIVQRCASLETANIVLHAANLWDWSILRIEIPVCVWAQVSHNLIGGQPTLGSVGSPAAQAREQYAQNIKQAATHTY